MGELESLEAAIRELEARRPALGEALTEAALAPLRHRLAALGSAEGRAAAGLPAPPASPAGPGPASPGPGPAASPSREPGPAAGRVFSEGPRGERKLATVLFADVAGYTRLVASSDPESVRELLTAAFEALAPLVEEAGGTLEKFIGDAIMALFGVPLSHGDDARRACLAALAMRERLGRLNRLRGSALELHFGIGSGLVVAGALEVGGRQGYSAVGNAVNRAARIAALAEGGSILVDGETRELAGEGLVFSPLPPASLKGFPEPLPVFRLEGEGRRSGACAEEAFVGREAELKALLGAWEGAGRGLVLIRGEAGIGKTRLGREAARRLGAEGGGPRLLEVRVGAFDRGSALRLFRSLLDRAAGIPPLAGRAARTERLAALAEEAGLGPAASRSLAALGRRPGAEGELPEAELEEAEAPGLEELAAALRELLGALASPAGLILLLDGLEGADPASLALLSALAAAPLPPGLLLLLLSREPLPGLGAAAEGLLDLPLGPLSAEESRELSRALLEGREARPEELERAGGNPLFLEELLGRGEEAGSIPAALFGLVAARIDALPPEERESARIAAVLGERFPEELLLAAGGQEPAGLLSAGLLAREGGLLGFRQPLFREIVYASLLGSRRRELHGRAARAIKELYPEYAEERPELLAEHWREAGEGRRALPYYKSAATELLYRGSLEAALDYLDLGLSLAREAGLEVALADFLSLRGRALARSGRPGEALAAWEEALGLQRRLGNLSRILQLERSRAYALSGLGRRAEAEAILRGAWELALAAEARKDLARLGLELASLVLGRGEAAQALALAREAQLAAERAKQLPAYRRLLVLQAEAQAALGRVEESRTLYRRAAEAFELSGEPEAAAALRAKAEAGGP